MPRPTRRCGSRWVMSRPSSQMLPDVGRSTPVRRLMIVVLPAPLGPISAWRAPFSTESDTLSVAMMPPKFFSKPLVSSTGGMGTPRFAAQARLHATPQSLRALGDGGCVGQDLRPRDPEREQERDGEHDA